MISELTQQEVSRVSGSAGVFIEAGLYFVAGVASAWYGGICADRKGVIDTGVCYAINSGVFAVVSPIQAALEALGITGERIDALYINLVLQIFKRKARAKIG